MPNDQFCVVHLPHDKRVVSCALAVTLAAAAFCFAQTPPENARVTLTVTNFRVMKSLTSPQYVDATTALAPHSAVSLLDRNGIPALRIKAAVNIEIAVASSDPAESYRALAVYFRQKPNASTVVLDPDGAINHSSSFSPSGTLVMHHNFVLGGNDGYYEFFVLIQRVSDGAIGLIDPEEETDPTEPP